MNFKYTLFILTVLMLCAIGAIAQVAPPASSPPPAAVPLGGLEILLAGGVAYGVKKFHDRKKNID
jgi:hypothetical protein